jgi:anti-anti-sigma factor
MDVTTRELGGCTLVRVSGRLDAAGGPVFEKAFEEILAGGVRKIVLDFSALEYISSGGLRGVLSGMKRLKAAGGGLVVSGLGGVVKEVFAISGFDTLVPVKATADEAAASL